MEQPFVIADPPEDVTADFVARMGKGSGALQWLAERAASAKRHGRVCQIEPAALLEAIAGLERRIEQAEERLGDHEFGADG